MSSLGTWPNRALLAVVVVASSGCHAWHGRGDRVAQHVDVAHYEYTATRLSEPDVAGTLDAACTAPPLTINCVPHEYWDITLEEAIHTALANSKVLRDLDATLLRVPASSRTTFDPAVTETDPRFGLESALSEFDASFATSAFFEKNDRALNNIFFGGGIRTLEQDTFIVQSQLAKRAVTGTELSVRNELNYDANNAPGNAFGSAYDLNPEIVLRHPLLAGSGVEFNRIAGPSNTPGLYNGVVLARINTDVDLADFEIGVRNFVNDVENAYWDLYFAYRDLDARIRARDEALELWQTVHTWYTTGRKGGDAASEAQAREQYYRFEEELQNALTGRLVDGTATNNGSSGGTFRPNGGVLVAERRLRLLMGVDLADGRALRPVNEPPSAEITFDWCEAVAEALSRRTELRRQKWQVKKRELELLASCNFLKPEFDVVGRYRWRGFGKDLIDQHSNEAFNLANGGAGFPDPARFDDALGTLASGDFQEWQLGFELNMPLGFRKGHAAVRNAELLLARERALLFEQERTVAKNLGDSVAELERAYVVVKTTYNRLEAARAQYESLRAVYEEGEEPLRQEQLYILLESQRRWTEAEVAFHRSATEYSLAVKNVHFEKGSLLDYNQVILEEGLWPSKAYRDAREKQMLRGEPHAPGHAEIPRPITRGPAPQNVVGPGAVQFFGEGSHVQPPAGDENVPPVVPPAPGAEAVPGERLPAPTPGDAASGPPAPRELPMPDSTSRPRAIPGAGTDGPRSGSATILPAGGTNLAPGRVESLSGPPRPSPPSVATPPAANDGGAVESWMSSDGKVLAPLRIIPAEPRKEISAVRPAAATAEDGWMFDQE